MDLHVDRSVGIFIFALVSRKKPDANNSTQLLAIAQIALDMSSEFNELGQK